MNNPNPTDTTSSNNGNKNQIPVNQSDSTVNLIELVYRILDKAVLIVLAAVLGALLMGKLAGSSTVTTYYSTSKLYLINTNDITLSMSDLQAANYLVSDYLAVFQTKELHQLVADEANLVYTADQLSGMVSAGNITDTHIISITVRANSAEEAELLAGIYADVTGNLVERKLNVPKPVLFEEATPAVKSVISNIKQNYIIGAMIGLFLSCIAVVLHGIFDDRIRTPEDIQKTIGAETLGVVTKKKRLFTRRQCR